MNPSRHQGSPAHKKINNIRCQESPTHEKIFRQKFLFKNQNPLITGTLILTGAGLITRVIGFFNRIYLSHLIGAREMGIYQLIFPVYMVAFAFCCHGMELALSQMVAAFHTRPGKESSRRLVSTGIFFSLITSLLFSVLIYYYADFISIYILQEESCAICLKLMAPVLPFTAIRCCLHGYYIGQKKTFVPSMGQLIEQVVRVFSIWLIVQIINVENFTASLAVCGMVIGEIAGTIYTYISYKVHSEQSTPRKSSNSPNNYDSGKISNPSKKASGNSNHNFHLLPYGKELLRRAIPLTGNKLLLTMISALESVLIPFMLTYYYKDQDLALSMYGVLTGMALPFITFPSTLTNSLSVMLLPTISEAHAAGNKRQIHSTIEKTIKLCLTLGFTALLLFFFFGKSIGTYVFHNSSAGDFLFILSFLCPFLYLSSSGTSILNGLGLMKNAFFYNLTGIVIRIGAIIWLVPKMGIQGYLLGLLVAYLVLVGLQGMKIKKEALDG